MWVSIRETPYGKERAVGILLECILVEAAFLIFNLDRRFGLLSDASPSLLILI